MSNKMFYCMLERLRSIVDQSSNSALVVIVFVCGLEIKNSVFYGTVR